MQIRLDFLTLLTDESVSVAAPGVLPLEIVISAQVDTALLAIRDVRGVEVGEDVSDSIAPSTRVVLGLDTADPEMSVCIVGH